MADAKKMDPVLALTYGMPKTGKTCDLGFSFPKALFVAAPGALGAISETCGYEPTSVDARTVEDATLIIKKMGAAKKRPFEQLVIDDFSFMAEQTNGDLETKFSKNVFWQKSRQVVLEFRDAARYAGITVAINCWDAAPKTNRETGEYTRGGPQLAGKLREALPGLCDVVVRASHNANRKPWPVVYRCSADPAYVTGDRLNVANRVDPCPMNLAEMIRATGRHLPRLWPEQEGEVETIARLLLEHPPEATEELAEAIYAKLLNRFDSKRAYWTIRDSLDRALIRREMTRSSSTFFGAKPTLGGL